MTTIDPDPSEPNQPNQPGQPGQPSEPNEPSPSPNEPSRTPEETPFIEPKTYPIHPDIPVQPIHENDPTRC